MTALLGYGPAISEHVVIDAGLDPDLPLNPEAAAKAKAAKAAAKAAAAAKAGGKKKQGGKQGAAEAEGGEEEGAGKEEGEEQQEGEEGAAAEAEAAAAAERASIKHCLNTEQLGALHAALGRLDAWFAGEFGHCSWGLGVLQANRQLVRGLLLWVAASQGHASDDLMFQVVTLCTQLRSTGLENPPGPLGIITCLPLAKGARKGGAKKAEAGQCLGRPGFLLRLPSPCALGQAAAWTCLWLTRASGMITCNSGSLMSFTLAHTACTRHLLQGQWRVGRRVRRRRRRTSFTMSSTRCC